jgi:Mobilization protein NikA
MMETKEKPTRKGSPPIKVYCLPEERRQIEANANAAGRSLSTYLLNVGIGYQIRGIVDHKQVEELARINGDLGRLGGLLKLWLTDDERTAEFGKATIRAVLARIEATQDQMIELMNRVIRPKAGR